MKLSLHSREIYRNQYNNVTVMVDLPIMIMDCKGIILACVVPRLASWTQVNNNEKKCPVGNQIERKLLRLDVNDGVCTETIW